MLWFNSLHWRRGKAHSVVDVNEVAWQVIEAAVENIPIKQQIFADLEKACSAECILSSNTSTIDISLVGKKTSAADRIVGAHFFSPAHIMPLLEIVRTTETSKQVCCMP